MAEAALFGLASRLIGSFDQMKGRQRTHLAKECDKLKTSVQAIRGVLLDAERQQESSAAVKCWIKQVGDVLYEAEDMVDEISVNGELNQQTEENKIRNQVLGILSPTNLFSYASRVSGRLHALSKSLDRIYKESEMFSFKREESEGGIAAVTGGFEEEESYVDVNGVVGREEDKKSIVDFLMDSNVEKNVIAIVGIGGMGKSTLAQLVYNDKLDGHKFENRWWASISDVDNDKEILRRIGKAIGVDLKKDDELEGRIKESVGKSGKYLLVIDGVRDDNRKKWSARMNLLHNGSEGCWIIVTTRSSSAAKAMEATKTHVLCGLSDEESYRLFEAMAFTEEKKGDQVWEGRGREIATKCSGVPLAIKRIAILLREKKDWESFMKVELSKVALSDNLVLSVLKLSYDQLPSDLKRCFAYCSLFPKNYVISKHKLQYLWIAQGYINPGSGQTLEEVGDAYFKQLLSLRFLHKAEQDEAGEIEHYKMHDLVHDLAQLVAGDETAIMSKHSNLDPSARHVSVAYDTTIPQLLSDDRLRSCIFMTTDLHGSSPFDPQQLTKFRFLRALDLSELGIKDVTCIEGFKLLRYLNLSRNPINTLPNSISKLSNLLSLDISRCEELEAWPKDFKRLVKLRHLDYSHCPRLTQMPDGFGELTGLRHLSGFKVGCKNNELGELSGMMPKGKLKIVFGADVGGDQSLRLPATIQVLEICSYPGESLKLNDETATAIVRLELHRCERLKKLPALRILCNLKTLVVNSVKELEYVEEDDAPSTFPCLEKLSLIQLPGLKGWTKANKLGGGIFPRLKELEIVECPLWDIWGDGNVDWGSLSGLRNLRISPMPTPDKLPKCLEERKVRVMKGSPPRIEEDKVANWPTPEDSQTRTHGEDKGSNKGVSIKRGSSRKGESSRS